MGMKIKIWGARGSLPSPLLPSALETRMQTLMEGFFDAGFKKKSDIPSYFSQLPPHQLGGYGGNTPCVEIRTPNHQIIVDGGSGIRTLGYELLGGPCGRGTGEAHIFFTHFHWDHLIGLPFFTPIFIPGNTIHVYAVQPDLRDVFRTIFKKPYFPLNLEQLGAKIEYHSLEPRKTIQFGDIRVTPYQLDHPDPCWGYKFEHGGKVFSHCVDTEATRVTPEQLGPDLPLYQNVDLMIFDAQYTLMETIEKVNWGHAAASIGLDIAMREGVKEVVFMHHDPASSDEKIAMAEQQARRYYDSQLKISRRNALPIREVKWTYAREGTCFEL
jgi:phosphoribosyl 1,2-cyclic phosphodiesterase